MPPEDTTKSSGTDWLATALFPLAVVLMEAFWFFPWLYWLGSWPMYPEPRQPLSLAAVIVVLAAALALTKLIDRHEEWPLAWARTAVVGLGAAALLVVLRLAYPPPAGTGWFSYVGDLLNHTFQHPSTIVVAGLAVIYLWWRGISLGRTTTYFRDVYRLFVVGMVALIVLLIFWQISSYNERFSGPAQDVGMYVIGFFFFGLLAIAVCHLYAIRRTMPKEEAALTSVKRWLPIMLAVVGGMVLVGFGVGLIFSPEFFDWVGRAAHTVGHALSTAAEYILMPIGYILEGIIWLVRWFLDLIRGNLSGLQQGGSANQTPLFQNVSTKAWPPEILTALKVLVLVAVLGLVVYFIARAVSRSRGRRELEDIEEIHESLFSWAGLRDDLKDLLGNLKNRLTPRRRPRPRTYGDDAGTLDVREIYRRLLWESARSGLPRHPGETVEEYARRLGRLVPDSAGPLGGINPAYEEARYGDRPLAGERVQGANQLWRGLRAVLRRLRGANE